MAEEKRNEAKDFREKVDSAITGIGTRLKNAVVGSPEQNAKAKEEMRKMDEEKPDTTQAKVNKALGMKSGGKVAGKLATRGYGKAR
jgi:hypothetical protein